ncbi:MAG: tRNA uridine 5-carboxymethylaminomethyl modification enzyme [Acidobacteriota bacterium]|nr:tRNA uridine 5-carboxymethylaminomethyl modification enzyme [Acidobacteriota bacterium]
MSFDEKFDVLVIGAGHAGCEAASAAARMGASTALVTLNLDLIGQMSCNPAIGGIAKGHLVREIDALGGIMGRVIDRTGIQFRLLNRSRGPAVQSPRAQADRALYRNEMRIMLESTPNLYLRQGEITDFVIKEGQILGVELQDTRRLRADAVVLATGTFLNGLIHTGKKTYTAGRSGEPASIRLASRLKQLGFMMGRLKTGTPPRLDGRTIDWAQFAPQSGDEEPVPFSFSTNYINQPQITCFIGYTNEHVHRIIRDNISESPLYSGQITGVGPRYCPSIEDKVIKFPSKNRHQLFLEPEGHNTSEVYLNGFSTSMPAGLQHQLVHSVLGLEEASIIRPGYAIEYDYCDPKELTPFLQTLRIKGLFFAGQINGTTGYEEAACQGLLAGINASLYTRKKEGFKLSRSEAYIGVLIDDLINHGVDEPYRIFTSRAEKRLSLRYDTADLRLSAYGRDLGLVDDISWENFNARRNRISSLHKFLESTRVKRSDVLYQELAQCSGTDLGDSISFAEFSVRSDLNIKVFRSVVGKLYQSSIINNELKTVLADLLYQGYINIQENNYSNVHKYDNLVIPNNFSFRDLSTLSNEMIERFERVCPSDFSEARKISGITPVALASLLTHLRLIPT